MPLILTRSLSFCQVAATSRTSRFRTHALDEHHISNLDSRQLPVATAMQVALARPMDARDDEDDEPPVVDNVEAAERCRQTVTKVPAWPRGTL